MHDIANSQSAKIRVAPWSTEKPLTILVAVVSFFLWGLLFLSVIGLIYGFIIFIFLFIGHIIFIAHVRGNAVRLSPEQCPDLYASVERLSIQMGFKKIPEAYLMQAGGALNALATRFFNSNLIILFSDLIEACGDNTSARDMIVAHELGHLKEGHLKWFWFLAPGLFFPFLGSALSRAREYTSDRYGLAGAGDKKGAMLGLAILAAGGEKGPQVNLKAMAQQVKDLNTGWMTIGQWLSSHPTLAKRIIALDDSLRPTFDYSQKGLLRALGMIGVMGVFLIASSILAIIGFRKLDRLSELQRLEAKGGMRGINSYYPKKSKTVSLKSVRSYPKIGIDECDEYFEKYPKCIMGHTFSEESKVALEDVFENSSQQWSEMAAEGGGSRETARLHCKQALDVAKRVAKIYDCEW